MKIDTHYSIPDSGQCTGAYDMVADCCKPRIIERYTSEVCAQVVFIFFTLVLASLLCSGANCTYINF